MTRSRVRFFVVAVVLGAFVAVPVSVYAKAKAKAKPMTTAFTLTNLDEGTDPADIKTLQTKVKAVKGVMSAKVNTSEGTLTVTHSKKATNEAILTAIDEAGFSVEEPDDSDGDVDDSDMY